MIRQNRTEFENSIMDMLCRFCILEIKRERQTDTDRQIQRERETDRETEREIPCCCLGEVLFGAAAGSVSGLG